MDQSIKRETASLLLEFCKVDAEKKSPFWEKWDEKILDIEQKMSTTDMVIGKQIIKDWRYNDSIPTDLYCFLRRNYPVPIPHVLFFSYKNGLIIENCKWIGDLADKWLKDIFSRESFYKRNKEYFTRAEVKYFLTCYWHESAGKCSDLIDDFFNTKIKANDLNLSLNVFQDFSGCFTHQIVIEYFKFLCDNKKYINNEEIMQINKFLKDEYISAEKNINFKNHTYHSIKWLCMIKDRFGYYYYQKIVQDYINFIYKNVKKIRDEEEIRDICDFLRTKYFINGKDFNFENITWQELKRLSDKWHISNMFRNAIENLDHKIAQNCLLFICKNMEKIRDRKKEIRDILDFLNNRINNGQDFDFGNTTWQKLKRLSDEWYVSNMFRERSGHRCEHKIIQDYISFIVKEIRRGIGREEEIIDIYDFLRTEYINNDRDFNFENMTWQELKRLSDEWHLEIRERYVRAYIEKMLNAEWKKSTIKDFCYKKDGKTWTIKEITTGESLYEEGEKMHHCVFSYADACIRGYCYIFSVSCKSGKDDSEKRIATVEISRSMRLVQARGPRNASIDNDTASIIKIWADENGIDCGNYLSNRNQFYGQVA
jgi:hypothetical protein